MDTEVKYFRNYGIESAEIIGTLFPDSIYHDFNTIETSDNQIQDDDFDLMFSVPHDYCLDSANKISLEAIDIKKLIKYIDHMRSTTISCVAWCHELNDNILEIMKHITKSNINIRLLYVMSWNIDISQQVKIVKKLDNICGKTKKKCEIRFKKCHADTNVVADLNKISLKNIKTRIKIIFDIINLKKLGLIFNGTENKIKYSLIINVEVKKQKKNIVIPKLQNVEYIGFYQKYGKDNKITKIKISWPIKYISLINYCKPIEITHDQIKKLKLLNCSGKSFSLKCFSEKHCVNTLLIKHTEYIEFYKIIGNIIVHAMHVYIKDILMSDGYQQFLDSSIETMLQEFHTSATNRKDLLSMSKHWNKIINLNQIGKLETVTFKNFPTLVFLNSMLLFSRDVTTVNYINNYSYMVYEGTVSDEILYSYAVFNDNSNMAYYIGHHGYDLINFCAFFKGDTKEDLPCNENMPFHTYSRFNSCAEEEKIKCYGRALFTNILQSFLINKNA